MTDDEVISAAQKGTFVTVSKYTPLVILQNVEGAQNLEMIMSFAKIYLDMNEGGVLKGNYHNLGADTMKQLGNLISDPDAIVKMDNGRLNLFSTVKSDKGNNNVISIELNTVKNINNSYKKYNLVVTAFNSKNNYIKNLLSKHGVSVEYTKKDLSQVNSQLYEWLAIVNDKSSTDSIPQNKNTVNGSISEDSRKYSIKNPTYTQDDLKNNAVIVRKMKSVKDLKGNEFDGNGKLSDRIDSYFEELGNNVYSEELGDIALSKASRRSEIRHGRTRTKIASYAAISEVIQNGKVIAIGKKENVERVVVAAPITINNESYYMGVMLQRDGRNQRLYLHDVITEKETTMSTPEFLITQTGASVENDNLYMTRILQKALNVKTDNQDVNSVSYSSKKNSNLATVADEKSPASTSKTNSSTVTINSIPQNKNTVNGSISEKTSKKGVVTESYKKEWTLSAKEKVTESVIKQIANEYAKRGVNVDIVYDENGHNGQWNPKTNTVTVNLAANNPLAAFFHETSHMVKQYSGEYWNDISLMCITYLAKANKTSISELADIKKKLYQTENEEFVNEELVSDAVSLIAQDKQAVRKLYSQLLESGKPKGRVQKILDKFKEVLMRLRTHFIKLGKSFNTNIEAVGMSEISGFSSYVNELSEGLSTAINELETYGEDEKVKFSVRESEKYTFDTAHNSFTDYKADTKNNLKLRNIEIVDNENQLENIISNALDNRQSKNNYCLGAVSDDLLTKIKGDIGENIFKNGQYSFIISSDDIRHIQEHFKDTKDIKQTKHILFMLRNMHCYQTDHTLTYISHQVILLL